MKKFKQTEIELETKKASSLSNQSRHNFIEDPANSIYGHGQLSQTLLRDGLIDEIRLSVFPVLVGSGKLFFREGERAALQLGRQAESLTAGER